MSSSFTVLITEFIQRILKRNPEENIAEKLALEEMRRLLDEHSKSSDMLDRKAMTLLGSASFIISLFGLLQLRLISGAQPDAYRLGIVVVVILYIILVFLTTNALKPRKYRSPIAPEWDVISENIFEKESKDALFTMVSGYIESINCYENHTAEKARLIRIASWCLSFIVLLLFILSLFTNR